MTAPRTDPPTPDPLTAERTITHQHGNWHSHSLTDLGANDGTDPHVHRPCREDEALAAGHLSGYEEGIDATLDAALPSAPDQRLREALDRIERTTQQLVDDDGVHWYRAAEVRAALSEATTSPEAALDVERLGDILAGYRERDGRYTPPLTGDPPRLSDPHEFARDIAARLRGPA